MKRYFISDIMSIYTKEMKDFAKDKSMIFMTIMQPLIWLILMGSGMRGLTDNMQYANNILDGAPNYLTFLTPGIMIMTALYGGLYGGVTLLSDIRFGYINRLLSSPISRASIVIGKIMATVVQTGMQIIFVILFSLLLGVRYQAGIWGILIIIIIASFFCIIMASISLILSTIFKTHNAIYSLVSFITLPLMFTSNAMFPNSSMPEWLNVITYINPITYAVKPIRELIVSQNIISNFWINSGIVFVLACIFMGFTIKRFHAKFI
ncbi:ABC transporter permease [Clostridium sp. SHJSY1]|uniref:ABC transporter permease n=1 Tax=Clostridium sp. SHJSY1 TaxID=2942483 RepID=UPI002873F569|nr:ABC transporter permease [Clostridium sp. SHJSY1]MDS0527086.1 ABC transporter permease [Clostridium sp. SHJSY1]